MSFMIPVRAAGNKCLPFIVDVKNETQIQEAVDEAIKSSNHLRDWHIVNNASAIYLTGTAETPSKIFDLMQHIMGYFLCK